MALVVRKRRFSLITGHFESDRPLLYDKRPTLYLPAPVRCYLSDPTFPLVILQLIFAGFLVDYTAFKGLVRSCSYFYNLYKQIKLVPWSYYAIYCEGRRYYEFLNGKRIRAGMWDEKTKSVMEIVYYHGMSYATVRKNTERYGLTKRKCLVHMIDGDGVAVTYNHNGCIKTVMNQKTGLLIEVEFTTPSAFVTGYKATYETEWIDKKYPIDIDVEGDKNWYTWDMWDIDDETEESEEEEEEEEAVTEARTKARDRLAKEKIAYKQFKMEFTEDGRILSEQEMIGDRVVLTTYSYDSWDYTHEDLITQRIYWGDCTIKDADCGPVLCDRLADLTEDEFRANSGPTLGELSNYILPSSHCYRCSDEDGPSHLSC